MEVTKSSKKVRVFYGKFFLPWNPIIRLSTDHKDVIQKVIVFDLDETLGSFGDLYILWAGILHIYPEYSKFNSLLDLYPEFIRYGVYSILRFLYHKKKSGECSKIYIYTNNQCPNKWVSYVLQYFQYKLNIEELFDNVIGAFKIKNKRIEISRTSHSKSYQDFIRCTLLPASTEICFIDDTEYEKMKNDKIYYICPQSYIHSLSVQEIITRITCSNLWTGDGLNQILKSVDYWENWFLIHNRNDSEYVYVDMQNVHLKISQKMMFYVKEFFLFSTKPGLFQTRRKNQRVRKTRKKKNR